MKLILLEGYNKQDMSILANELMDAIDRAYNNSKFIHLVHGMTPITGKDLNLILDTQKSFFNKIFNDSLEWYTDDEFDDEIHVTSIFSTAVDNIVNMGMSHEVMYNFIQEYTKKILSKINVDDVVVINLTNNVDEPNNKLSQKVMNDLLSMTQFKNVTIDKHYNIADLLVNI